MCKGMICRFTTGKCGILVFICALMIICTHAGKKITKSTHDISIAEWGKVNIVKFFSIDMSAALKL